MDFRYKFVVILNYLPVSLTYFNYFLIRYTPDQTNAYPTNQLGYEKSAALLLDLVVQVVGQQSRYPDKHVRQLGEGSQQAVHRLHYGEKVRKYPCSGRNHHKSGSQGQVAQKGVLGPQLSFLK